MHRSHHDLRWQDDSERTTNSECSSVREPVGGASEGPDGKAFPPASPRSCPHSAAQPGSHGDSSSSPAPVWLCYDGQDGCYKNPRCFSVQRNQVFFYLCDYLKYFKYSLCIVFEIFIQNTFFRQSIIPRPQWHKKPWGPSSGFPCPQCSRCGSSPPGSRILPVDQTGPWQANSR